MVTLGDITKWLEIIKWVGTSWVVVVVLKIIKYKEHIEK